MAGLRVDAAHRPDHLRAEQDAAGVDDREQQVDARLVVHAGVEGHVAHHRFLQRRPAEHVGQAAEAPPVVGDRAAPVRDDQLQVREVLEQVRLQELHERGGIGVEVVRAGGVEDRVVHPGDVHHGGHA